MATLKIQSPITVYDPRTDGLYVRLHLPREGGLIRSVDERFWALVVSTPGELEGVAELCEVAGGYPAGELVNYDRDGQITGLTLSREEGNGRPAEPGQAGEGHGEPTGEAGEEAGERHLADHREGPA